MNNEKIEKFSGDEYQEPFENINDNNINDNNINDNNIRHNDSINESFANNVIRKTKNNNQILIFTVSCISMVLLLVCLLIFKK